MSQSHEITTEERDGVVLTTVTDQAWACPLDPEDPCESFDDEETGKTEILCLTDRTTICKESGYYSSVYIADIATKKSLTFGTYVRRPRPSVAITSAQISVNAGDCMQVVKRLSNEGAGP
jgi:hypothetical protein